MMEKLNLMQGDEETSLFLLDEITVQLDRINKREACNILKRLQTPFILATNDETVINDLKKDTYFINLYTKPASVDKNCPLSN